VASFEAPIGGLLWAPADTEMIPEFHRYHLDDSADLTSCSLIVEQCEEVPEQRYASLPLSAERLQKFYGAESPLRWHYVRDLTNGGKLVSRDVSFEPFQN